MTKGETIGAEERNLGAEGLDLLIEEPRDLSIRSSICKNKISQKELTRNEPELHT
jgi:hypothetical protein